MNKVSFGGTTVGYENPLHPIEDLLGYLQTVKKLPDDFYFVGYGGSWDEDREAFKKLSTCRMSCGCTGYRPKTDCPDPKCFCNA